MNNSPYQKQKAEIVKMINEMETSFRENAPSTLSNSMMLEYSNVDNINTATKVNSSALK